MKEFIERAILENDINKEDINKFKRIYDFEKLKMNLWNEINKERNKLEQKQLFYKLRYYYLNINQSIYKLEIPFVKMCKQKDNLSNILTMYKFKSYKYYKEMYYYYYFILIEQIYCEIEKLMILINEAFQLNIKKGSNDFDSKILKELRKQQKSKSDEKISKLITFLQDYDTSKIKKCKENYRNPYNHDYTNEIPRLEQENEKMSIYLSLDLDKTFNDLLELLNEFKQFINIVDNAVIRYIDFYMEV